MFRSVSAFTHGERFERCQGTIFILGRTILWFEIVVSYCCLKYSEVRVFVSNIK